MPNLEIYDKQGQVTLWTYNQIQPKKRSAQKKFVTAKKMKVLWYE
jgi:hypothetical protein